MTMSIGNSNLLYNDFVPQAEIIHNSGYIRSNFAWEKGIDDLDYFEGAAFLMDGNVAFTIKHYRGYPKDQHTIFFKKIDNMKIVENYIGRIMRQLEIPPMSLIWKRPDDPLR